MLPVHVSIFPKPFPYQFSFVIFHENCLYFSRKINKPSLFSLKHMTSENTTTLLTRDICPNPAKPTDEERQCLKKQVDEVIVLPMHKVIASTHEQERRESKL